MSEQPNGPPPEANPHFPLDAIDPADLEITWERDDMHMPYALTPLASDYVEHTIGASFNYHHQRFGGPQTLLGRVWHGYAYFGFSWNVPTEQEDATKERWTQALRDRIPATAAYWRDDAMPELERLYASISSVPVDDLAAPELASAWQNAWAATLRAWQIHFVTIMGPYQVLEDLADQYNAALGPGRDVEALSLVRGQVHELEDVEARIDALAAMLAQSPELARAVAAQAAQAEMHDEEMPLDREAFDRVPGGPAFVAALVAFLEAHGHLGQNHDDLGAASWVEAPAMLFTSLARRIAGAGGAGGGGGAREASGGPDARLAELRRVAADRAEAVRAALADKPDELARFETTLGHALDIGHLTESHNYWIDRMAQARLRTLATRIGRRLVRDGVLDRAGDILFLRRDDVCDAVVDGQPRQELVRDRRAALERQRTVTPPRYVGPIPEDTGPPDRFDSVRIESTEANVLRGTGASAGVVRGPARVVESQDAFGLVQPGEIIVCPASNPSWVPIFTIAGGLVTNTGGVLSHAAVVAREFGLPAVVGVVGATGKIADGRMVEIDGTAGTVRLL
ncbi:MAG: PEP-utilizing enzyme [Candidatus Limnocylindrales bacterium]